MKPNSKEDRIFGINPNCRFVFSLVYKIPPCGFGNSFAVERVVGNCESFSTRHFPPFTKVSMFTSHLDNES